MPRRNIDDLTRYRRGLSVDALATLLIELADEHEAVRKRLVRLSLATKPDKLAADLRKSLAAWRRPSRFLPRSEAGRFGRELEAWLGQLELELLPKDPAAALELAEAFVESDAAFFERADDSNGVIGDAVRAGCRLWLKAAAQCEAPPDAWPARLAELASTDEYGARDLLWQRADLVLTDDQLRTLATQQMHRLEQAVAAAEGATSLPYEVYALSASLGLLAKAMHDPDVQVRAVLTYSPRPNSLQIEKFVQAYLDADRPEDALRWLDVSPWDRHEASRLSLRSVALARLGRAGESAAVREQLFRRNVTAENLVSWLEALTPGEQNRALAEARQLAERIRIR